MLKDEIIKFFEAKGRNYSEMTVVAWLEVLMEFKEDDVVKALNILKKKPDTFVDVGKVVEIIKSDDLPDAWNMVLTSSRNGGRYNITARAAKALNALGGMSRLMDASNDDLPWIKKEFDQVYLSTPEYSNVDGIRCLGLRAEILPDIDDKARCSDGTLKLEANKIQSGNV